jgi:hypothetical protein
MITPYFQHAHLATVIMSEAQSHVLYPRFVLLPFMGLIDIATRADRSVTKCIENIEHDRAKQTRSSNISYNVIIRIRLIVASVTRISFPIDFIEPSGTLAPLCHLFTPASIPAFKRPVFPDPNHFRSLLNQPPPTDIIHP